MWVPYWALKSLYTLEYRRLDGHDSVYCASVATSISLSKAMAYSHARNAKADARNEPHNYPLSKVSVRTEWTGFDFQFPRLGLLREFGCMQPQPCA